MSAFIDYELRVVNLPSDSHFVTRDVLEWKIWKENFDDRELKFRKMKFCFPDFPHDSQCASCGTVAILRKTIANIENTSAWMNPTNTSMARNGSGTKYGTR